MTTIPAATRQHIDDLARFVAASPSSFHAAAEIGRRLAAAGFARLDERDAWEVRAGGRHYVIRDGSVAAFVIPAAASAPCPFTMLGTHTDSPGFKLKPKPTTGTAGFLQAGVEVYGGPLLVSWLDRELALAGRVTTLDGTTHLVSTGPMFRIPSLAIHLDREANDKFTLDKQSGTQPVWGLGNADDADLLSTLVADVGLDPAEVGGYDLITVDTQPGRVFGADDALFASARLDNLLSTHAALAALLEAADDATATSVSVLAAFDHEEIGSESRSGAGGPFLGDVLARISATLGATPEQHSRALADSFLVSSDVGHAVHPNYSGKHDPANQPVAGGGPILKINANQRYATDAVGAARWQAACIAAGVPSQEFVSNNQSPCGSTIGPIASARLGVRTVDVGVGLLSMHSAREMTTVVDPWYLSRAMAQVLRG